MVYESQDAHINRIRFIYINIVRKTGLIAWFVICIYECDTVPRKYYDIIMDSILYFFFSKRSISILILVSNSEQYAWLFY